MRLHSTLLPFKHHAKMETYLWLHLKPFSQLLYAIHIPLTTKPEAVEIRSLIHHHLIFGPSAIFDLPLLCDFLSVDRFPLFLCHVLLWIGSDPLRTFLLLDLFGSVDPSTGACLLLSVFRLFISTPLSTR